MSDPRRSMHLDRMAVLMMMMVTAGCLISESRTGAAEALPENLAPFFAPPPELANELGSYRSPLLFDSDKKARSPTEWARRRAEIAKHWHDLMGPWPPLLAKPKFQVVSNTVQAGFEQARVRVETARDYMQDGWLLVPSGKGPMPAVLVLYYEPETSIGAGRAPHRDFALQLTQAGFVTLSIGTPGGNAWKPETAGATCQPLSFNAYVAANCWTALAALPHVDSNRIGVVGHSYGGKWALFAGAFWEKFAAIAVSDPGIVFDESRPNVNYWEPWYLGMDPAKPRPKAGVPGPENPRAGAYQIMVETGRDLHELHALLAPRPFLVSGGSEDPLERWIPLNHLLEVNRLLGCHHRVLFTTRESHAPTQTSNTQLLEFFNHFLRPRPDAK